MTPRAANRRIRLLLALFVLAFAVTFGRAVWLQGVQAGTFSQMASKQHLETVVVAAGRGTIFDRNGEPLAIGQAATTVHADPRQVLDPKATARTVARLLDLEANRLYPLLADRSRHFVYLKRKADPALAAKLERLELPGIGFTADELRAYPKRTVAAHVLGFSGLDNTGLEGLERALDRQLLGKPGSKTIVKDPTGRVIDEVEARPERAGADVFLTLDHRLQANTEAVLRETVRSSRAKGGMAIVLDPRTGAVLAMANAPTFDPNRSSTSQVASRRNRSVTDTYEPGSTFKLVTVAGALSDKLVTPTTPFTLQNSITVADRIIHEHDRQVTQRMTVAQILAQSSNVGTITLAQLLGKERVLAWIDRFGFGRRTGIDFPGETRGLMPSYWSGSTIGNVPIGQGIAVTGIQMATAYAAIANRGVLHRPYLVERIGGHAGGHGTGRRVVSATVAAQVMTMLRDVVAADGGTGAAAAVPGYTVAGKTGTAAKPEPGGYSTSRYVASFVGIVPAKSPRLVVLVAVDEPRTAIWGGVVAAPAFAKIAQFGLQYLEIPPDAQPPR